LYLCRYCKRDVTQQLRVMCVVCSTDDSRFELCGDCFAVGLNIDTHRNTHKYRVVDCIDGPIFSNDWTAGEELLMLEGISKHGVGNWKTITEYMNTGKTTAQLESHYWELYMGKYGLCLPSSLILHDNGCVVDESDITFMKNPMRIGLQEDHELGEDVVRDKGKEQISSSKEKGGGREKLYESQIRERIAQLPGADLPGYMPLRGDFDYEYENDAEVLLADMEFEEDDHPSERELKLQVIKIYNRKLDERDRRKRFVIDKGIVDFKQQQAVRTDML
jgi:transcriptional adapter 2-alpha